MLKNLLSQSSFWIINKKLAKEIGLEASLLLSDLIGKGNYFETEWFYNTRENIETDTGLTPHQQRTAIKKLVELGFIETKLKGMPQKAYYRILNDKVLKFLTTGCEKISQQEVKDFNINKNKEIRIKNKNKTEEPLWDNFLYLSPLLPDDNNAWLEWEKYRKEIRKKLTETTAKKQLKFLKTQPDPKAVIEQSIKNGWTGLFEVKHGKGNRGSFNEAKYRELLSEKS